ncbi:DUF3793 family protein [Faecalimonas sp.]
MSREIFEIVREMDLKNIETQLALQCAPLITGLKISNLLIVSVENERQVKEIIGKSGLSYYKMLQTEKKVTYLLFRRKQLEEFLCRKEIRQFFQQEGYSVFEFGKILKTFQMRYATYMKEGGVFPHEMGLLLGYPLEDVKGFMENEGRCFLYAGYWKVYENMTEKLKLFHKFEVAKETLIFLVYNGVHMEEIMTSYVG